MTEPQSELQAQIWKAKAEVWEEAFKIVLFTKEQPKNKIIQNEDNFPQIPDNHLQEQEAINHLENNILPKDGEVGAKGIWVEMFIAWIKPLAIELISRVLDHLIEKGTEWAIDGANLALLRLQDFLYDKYLLANDKQKETFKTKILEKFPESGLADKLRNE